MATREFKYTPPPKNALDNRKLVLFAKCPTAVGKYSTLTWSIINNNPRITVRTNDPDEMNKEQNWGRITAALDTPVFYAFLELIKEAVAAPNDWKKKILNKNYTFFTGKRSEKPEVVSELWVGKDKDGKVWISVIDALKPNRPKIQFFFECPNFHGFVEGDGSPVSDGKVSQLFAMGYVNILSQLMAHLSVTTFVDTDKKKEGQNNNRGGNQNRSQQSYEDTSSDDISDDDFPF